MDPTSAPAETPSQRLDRVGAQLPQPAFNLDLAFEQAAAALQPEAQAAKADVAQRGTLGALQDSIALGAVNAGLQAKDTLFGAPAEEDKWSFRKYLEAQSQALGERSAGYGVVQSVSQFATGMIGAGKILGVAGKVAPGAAKVAEAVGSTKLGGAALESTKAAAVGAMVFDPHQERLSNLIESVPELQNPVSRYLAAQPDDSAAEGRLKSAIESIGLDAAIGGTLFLGLKAYRAFSRGDTKVGEVAAKELAETHAAVPEFKDPIVQNPEVPQAANADVPLHVSSNDNIREGSPLNADTSGNPLGSAERSPAATGNPDTTMGATPVADNANAVPGPAVGQDNFAPGTSDPQKVDLTAPTGGLQAGAAPKTVGELFDAGTKPKAMAEDAGAAGAESVSGEIPKPFAAVQNASAGVKGIHKGAPPEILQPHPEDVATVLHNLQADTEALRTYGSKAAAEEAGYSFSASPIPWQKLDAPDEVLAFIGNMADALKPELDAVKGGEVLSDAAVQARVVRLANAYDQDPTAIIGNLQMAGDAATSMVAKMEAADAIATKMAQDAYEVADKIQKGLLTQWGGDEVAAMAEFARRVGVAMSTFGAARSMLSNSARTMRRARGDLDRLTFEEISKIRSLDGRDLLNLFTKTGGDTNAMKEALTRPTLWQKAGDLAGHLLVNNLLWGWKTFVVNLLGNTSMLALRPTEKWIGAAPLRAASFLGFEVPGASEVARRANYEMRATASEIFDTFFHFAESDTASAVWQSAKTYESVIDPHMVEASRVGAQTRPEFRPIENVSDLVHNAYAGFWHATGVPTRLMGAADELSKQIRYRAYVVAEARSRADDLGLGAVEAEEYIRRSLGEAFDANGAAVNTKALQEARTSTFQQELLRRGSTDTWGGASSVGAAVQDFTSNVPLSRAVLPFVKTPANVLRMGLKYTPGLNLLQKEYAAAISGMRGVEAQAQAIGQMVVGSLACAAIYTLAAQGKITGGGPSNPKLRSSLTSTGWQPYSLVSVGPDGKVSYTPFNRFDPIALPLGIIADWVDVSQHPGRLEGHEEALPLALAAAVAKNVLDKTYLRSLSFAVQAASDPEKSAAKYLGGTLGNMVPFASASRNYGGAPYLRDVRGVMDSIMANTPGLSADLPPRRDAFGEPITVNRGFWSSTKNNLVDNEMIRLGVEAGQGITAPSPRQHEVDLRDITLEDGSNAYDAFQVRAGRPKGSKPLKDVVADVIKSPSYQRMADGDGITSGTKSATLRDVVEKYRTAALRQMMAESPVLRNALTEAKRKAAAAYASAQSQPPAKAVGDTARLQGLLGAFGLGTTQD